MHISDVTYQYLKNKYVVEPGNGSMKDSLLKQYGIETFLVIEEICYENCIALEIDDAPSTPLPKKQSITIEWIPEIPFGDV